MTWESQVGLVVALCIVILALIWKARRRTRIRLGWKPGKSSVYVLRDAENPHLLKVGMTRRLVKTRKSEVSRDMAGGSRLKQVFAVDRMRFARAVEWLAHSKLRRFQAHCGRGREWFYAKPDGSIDHILSAVESSAHEVRTAAIRQKRWRPEWDATETAPRIWEVTRYGGRHRYLSNSSK